MDVVGVMAESYVAVEDDEPHIESNTNKERELVELSPDLREFSVSLVGKLVHLLDVLRQVVLTRGLGVELTEGSHSFSKLRDLTLAPGLFCRVTVGLQVSFKLVEVGHESSLHLVQVSRGVECRMEHSQIREWEGEVKQYRYDSS